MSSEDAPAGASVHISFLLQVTQFGFRVRPADTLSSIPHQTAGTDTVLWSTSSPVSAQHGSQSTHSLAHSRPLTREGSCALPEAGQLPSAGGDLAWQAREEAIWCGGRGQDGWLLEVFGHFGHPRETHGSVLARARPRAGTFLLLVRAL